MTKQIPLSQNYIALIDDSDFEVVSQYGWYVSISNQNSVYARGYVDGKPVYLHRFITNCPKGQLVKFIDGNELNCQRMNLVITNRSGVQNQSPRREIARALIRGGMTYQQIADRMNISIARANQLVGETKFEKRKLKDIANGKCQECGKPADKLDAHHDSYESAPTRLLCVPCHAKANLAQGLTPYHSRYAVKRTARLLGWTSEQVPAQKVKAAA